MVNARAQYHCLSIHDVHRSTALKTYIRMSVREDPEIAIDSVASERSNFGQNNSRFGRLNTKCAHLGLSMTSYIT